MKTIELHGILADKFGRFFKLDVDSVREATHAIASQIPAFKRFMLESEQAGRTFAVFLDDTTAERNIGEDEIDNITAAQVIHIMPKIAGAGGDSFGWIQTIAGAALVAVGFLASGLTAGASTALIGSGIGLMMGGVASLLMPTPEIDKQDPDGNRANYGFGGAVTTVAQGNPVPVLYGEREVGGFVATASIYTEDQQ